MTIDTDLKKHLYQTWNNMIGRCYDKNNEAFIKFYSDCSVDLRWHNFSNFYEDVLQIPNAHFKLATEKLNSSSISFSEHASVSISISECPFQTIISKMNPEMKNIFIEEIKTMKWELDKDILNHCNRIYSNTNCCWLPSQLNSYLNLINSLYYKGNKSTI
jgi:hypothetical protein